MVYQLTSSERGAVEMALSSANAGAAPYYEVYLTILAVLTDTNPQ